MGLSWKKSVVIFLTFTGLSVFLVACQGSGSGAGSGSSNGAKVDLPRVGM